MTSLDAIAGPAVDGVPVDGVVAVDGVGVSVVDGIGWLGSIPVVDSAGF
jgi:hypothetical protein